MLSQQIEAVPPQRGTTERNPQISLCTIAWRPESQTSRGICVQLAWWFVNRQIPRNIPVLIVSVESKGIPVMPCTFTVPHIFVAKHLAEDPQTADSKRRESTMKQTVEQSVCFFVVSRFFAVPHGTHGPSPSYNTLEVLGGLCTGGTLFLVGLFLYARYRRFIQLSLLYIIVSSGHLLARENPRRHMASS